MSPLGVPHRIRPVDEAMGREPHGDKATDMYHPRSQNAGRGELVHGKD